MFPIRSPIIAALALGGVALAGAATLTLASGDRPGLFSGGENPRLAVRPTNPEHIASLDTVETSEYQAAILADGTVTEDEMRAAVQQTVACLQAKGLNAEFLPSGRPSDPPSYRVVSSEQLDFDEAIKPCEDEYMSELGGPYARELERRYAAFSKEESVRRVEECIESKGFFLEDKTQYYSVEFQSTPEAGKAMTECLMKVRDERFPQ